MIESHIIKDRNLEQRYKFIINDPKEKLSYALKKVLEQYISGNTTHDTAATGKGVAPSTIKRQLKSLFGLTNLISGERPVNSLGMILKLMEYGFIIQVPLNGNNGIEKASELGDNND